VIITQKPGVAADYIADLEREVALVAKRLGQRTRLVQYHWGGGTPTYLSLEEIERVWRAFADRFTFEPGAEIAIEVDPRVTTHRQAELLRRLGFNRISMGVQDFDSDVQEAVNRYQTFNQTKDLHEHLRGLGIESINFDFIYGLPQQTPESFRKTIQLALELRPDRVAVYSYAFVPWIKAHQKAIRLEDLAAREVELELCGFAQNTKKLNRYKDALDRGRPPIERGFERSRDDEIRRDVIQSLMCNFYVDIRAIERAHGIEFATYFRESLLELDQGPGSNGFV